jgi:CHAD domain-containing protein
VARAREITDLAAADPYAVAAAKVVSVRAEELADHARDVLDTADIERVHDMRVASRRLRAALEIFEPCFPKQHFRAALSEVKALADALGERRDRDVSIAALESFVSEMAAPDRRGIESLIGSLRDEQRQANAELAGFVGREELASLRRRLERLAVEARSAVESE